MYEKPTILPADNVTIVCLEHCTQSLASPLHFSLFALPLPLPKSPRCRTEPPAVFPPGFEHRSILVLLDLLPIVMVSARSHQGLLACSSLLGTPLSPVS